MGNGLEVQKNSDVFFWLLAALIMICIFTLFGEASVVKALICWAKWLDAAAPHFFVDDVDIEERLLGLGDEPDFSSLFDLLNQVSLFFAVVVAIFMLAALFVALRLSVRERYRKRHSMQSLLQYTAGIYPSVAPILNLGLSLLDLDPDRGLFRTARQPIQFAAEHALILLPDGRAASRELLLDGAGLANQKSPLLAGTIRASMDRARARSVLEAQFGDIFRGFSQLPAFLYALSFAFILFGLERKKEAFKILDAMNLSFRVKGNVRSVLQDGKSPCFIMASQTYLSENEEKELLSRAEIRAAIRPHNRYLCLVILSLYAFARQKGVLCTSEFIWLRPIWRELFLLLNSFGRRTVWVEVAGPWAHYQAEETLAGRRENFEGLDIPEAEKCVEAAVAGLERALWEGGWIKTEGADGHFFGR